MENLEKNTLRDSASTKDQKQIIREQLIPDLGLRKIRLNGLWSQLEKVDPANRESFDSRFYNSVVVAMAIKELEAYQNAYEDEFTPENKERLKNIKTKREQYFAKQAEAV